MLQINANKSRKKVYNSEVLRILLKGFLEVSRTFVICFLEKEVQKPICQNDSLPTVGFPLVLHQPMHRCLKAYGVD